MKTKTLEASVQYGDYSGTVAADGHDREDIFALARKYGIDTERYFILGIEFYIGEIRDDKKMHPPIVSILAIDSRVVKAYGVDAIQDYIDRNNGHLPYTKFSIETSLEEILLSFKRFDVVLKNSHLKRIQEYEEI